MAIIPLFGMKASSLAKLAKIGSRSLPVLSVFRTHKFVRRVIKLVAGSVITFSVAAVGHSLNRCPQTGRYRLLMTSPDEDVEIGNRMSHSLLSSLPKDAVLPSSHPLTRLCQRLVDRISLACDFEKGQNLAFEIIVVSDTLKNAYSIPNGDIVVHAGLIGDVRNEDELAGLLAHEMAHTILRHSSEVVSISDLARVPSGFLYSAIALTGPGVISGALRWLAVEMTQPERLLAELPTSRRLEAEADQYGVDLMVRAGYSPRKFLEYWKRQPVDDAKNYFASTHPHSRDRIRILEEYIERMPRLEDESRRTNDPTLQYWIDRISSQL